MLPYDVFPRVQAALGYLARGYTLTRACDTAQLSPSTFRRWIETSPELKDQFSDAEQRGYDTMADVLLDIFADPHLGQTDATKAKIISDNIKWYLARKRPAQYGDRTLVDIHVTADKAIVEALARGRERAEHGQIEDAAFTVIPSLPSKQTDDIPDELKQFF